MPQYCRLALLAAVSIWASGCGNQAQRDGNVPGDRWEELRRAADELHEGVLIAISEAREIERLEQAASAKGISIDRAETANMVIEAMIIKMSSPLLATLEAFRDLRAKRLAQRYAPDVRDAAAQREEEMREKMK